MRGGPIRVRKRGLKPTPFSHWFGPSIRDVRLLTAEGPRWLVGKNLATRGDIEHTEAHGCLDGADPDAVSDRSLSIPLSARSSAGPWRIT